MMTVFDILSFSVWISSSADFFGLHTYQQTDAPWAVSGLLRGLSLYALVQRDPVLTLLWCFYSEIENKQKE